MPDTDSNELRDTLRKIPVVKSWVAPPPRVAVVRLEGSIGGRGSLGRGGLALPTLAPVLKAAFGMRHAKAVALQINSPGGSPVQSALIAKRIRSLAEEKELPVYAFCEDVAASGGYWLAAAADRIYADENSIIGSIGVIAGGFGFVEALEKLGLERRKYTAGARKGMLDPFEPEREREVAHLHGLLDEMHQSFKDMVRARRGDRLKPPEDDPDGLFDGAFWTGASAMDLGLIDEIGDIRTVMREEYGEDVQLRLVRRRRGLGERLGLGRASVDGGPAARLDGTALGRDAALGVMAALEERALWSRYGL